MNRKRHCPKLENEDVTDFKELLLDAAYYLRDYASLQKEKTSYEDLEKKDITYIKNVLQDAKKSLFKVKSKELV